MSAIVALGGPCNLNCVVCPMPRRPRPLTASRARALIDEAARAGARRVLFAGGEPLLRRDLAELATHARCAGLSPGVATNGRLLVYPSARQALSRAGIGRVVVGPVYGDARSHDALARSPGAFVQTAAALRRLLEDASLEVEVRMPVLRGFAPECSAAWSSLARGAKARLSFSFYYPASRPDAPPDEAARLASRSAAEFRAAGLDSRLEGLPSCIVAPAVRGASELARSLGGASCLDLPLGASKPLGCSECSLEGSCPGVARAAARLFAFDAVRPVKAVRSNSFDYTFEERLAGFAPSAEGCRGESLAAKGDPARSVYLEKEDGSFALYRADTTCFSDAELRQAKLERRQLYVDVSGKVMLDDFQKDVRRLEPLEACRDCAKRGRCGVCWRVVDEVPFEREERWLRQEIRRLVGRVLDIGCGDLRFYRETAGRLVADGTIEYHALDVDARALASLKAEHPRANVHVAGIEDFDFQPGYFDYVFALRSLNHFYDMERAFAAMTALLRDRGMIVLAECVPFGLLRSRGQTRRARQAAEPVFEHYRNWSSEQVLEFIKKKGFPLRLNVHRPVRPGTSNQWLLKLIKTEAR